MIGIVLVSHSARLADGALELAREMAGPEAAMAACGGLDLPGQPLGTDPSRVADAIRTLLAQHSPPLDGILVLMDLGSAVLSAEMAVELLPPEQQVLVRLCPAPLVEGAVAAAVQARLGSSLEQAAAEAQRALEPKLNQVDSIKEPAGLLVAQTAPANSPASDQPLSGEILVPNRLGLHARPAARLVQLAAQYPGTGLQVSNLTRGTGPASARSLNALATLGARQGDLLKVEATGAGAAEALRAFVELAQAGFGDPDSAEPIAEKPIPLPKISKLSGSLTLSGQAASPGIAVGPARFYQPEVPAILHEESSDPNAEWKRLETALQAVQAQIQRAKQLAADRSQGESAAIFDAHRLMLEDEAVLQPARQGIFEQKKNAAWAWTDAVQALVRQYHALEDSYQRLRAADLEDLNAQVLTSLAGKTSHPVHLASPGILIISELSPAAAAHLDPNQVLGIVSLRGSPNAHSAVLVRAQGIAMVTGLGELPPGIEEDTPVIVDGSRGEVILNPDAARVDDYSRQLQAQRSAQLAALAASQAPAVTLDGRRLEIAANIGSIDGAQAALSAGAEAVGLFRSEFLFLDRQDGPNEEEQAAAYRQAAAALQGRSLIIRTLDAGGDKPLPYLNLPSEANPFLGWRAMRVCLDQPEFFKTQLRAILRTAADFPVRIMFPMIATLQDWRQGKRLLDEARQELQARGLAVPDRVETGIMVEIPAAALQAESFAAEVDFFSIGTNDLTQYTLAAERGSPRLAGYSDPFHPAVLQLIERVVQAAHTHQKWVGVCGEMAGEPLAIPLLTGLGVDELSMNPPAIPAAKQIICSISYSQAQQAAGLALACESAQQVRAILEPMLSSTEIRR